MLIKEKLTYAFFDGFRRRNRRRTGRRGALNSRFGHVGNVSVQNGQVLGDDIGVHHADMNSDRLLIGWLCDGNCDGKSENNKSVFGESSEGARDDRDGQVSISGGEEDR